MAADHIIVVVFGGQLDGGFFKIAHEFHCFFYPVFYLLGKRHPAHSQAHAYFVNPAIDEDEQVVAFAAEARDERRVTNENVENVSVKNPVGFVFEFQ